MPQQGEGHSLAGEDPPRSQRWQRVFLMRELDVDEPAMGATGQPGYSCCH